MKIALVSDVHANLPALEAVLAAIAQRGDVDATYHLGDLVGYAPWPNQVVERIRDAGIAGVSGNALGVLGRSRAIGGVRRLAAPSRAVRSPAVERPP